MLLAGDLGGTTTRLGLFDAATPRPELRAVHEFATLDHSGLAPMVIEFLRQNDVGPEVVDVAAIGVAGPVVGQTARLTNVPWPVSAAELRQQTGLAHVELLNDAEAMALAVPVLRPDELAVIHPGMADPEGTAVLLTVGTGLGVSFLHRDARPTDPDAVRGGTCRLSASDAARARPGAIPAGNFSSCRLIFFL